MKKISNKILLLLAIIFILSVSLIGCAPKGESKEILDKYYESIKNGDIEVAYETLCEQSKKDFKKEDFIKWQNADKEIYKLQETKIEKSKEFEGKLDDIEFKNIAEFNIIEKGKKLYEDKEKEIKYKMYVVNDNGNWKIYFGKKTGNQLASNSLTELARRNLTKDVDKASILLEEAIRLDPDNKDAEILLKRIPQIKAINSLK